jgi:phage tail sheath protein FI
MAETFLHGVELLEVESGTRPVQTVASSVIGICGTAEDADAVKFPLNTPVLVTSDKALADLGTDGTLVDAIKGIFGQTGAVCVLVRVAEGVDDAATIAAIKGGVNATTGNYEGVHAFKSAESVLGVVPRILIAPDFSKNAAIVTEMVTIADSLRAVIVVDGPNTTDTAATAYAEGFASPRVYVVDPWVKVLDSTGAEVDAPISPRVAGVIAKSDNTRGFWTSPSNQEILGIVGTSRAVDFSLGDATSRANLLNEGNVATVIRKDGFRLWGNRSCSSDAKWAFLCVRRTADMINDSLLRTHLWAVDKGITKTYTSEVVEGVKGYLRTLRSIGAIINGDAWADKELNSPENIQLGKSYFDFDFTPVYPAERVVFRSQLTNKYLTEVL